MILELTLDTDRCTKDSNIEAETDRWMTDAVLKTTVLLTHSSKIADTVNLIFFIKGVFCILLLPVHHILKCSARLFCPREDV